MEVTTIIIAAATIVVLVSWGWGVLNWLWLKPKKIERLLRAQGLQGTPYKVLVGDSKDFMKMQRETKTKPMNTSDDDIVPRTMPYVLQCYNKYGKNSFSWFGGIPRLIVTDPELIKDVFNKIYDFPKPDTNPLIKLLVNGLAGHGGEKWSKHRRIINPAFHLEKLKDILVILHPRPSLEISRRAATRRLNTTFSDWQLLPPDFIPDPRPARLFRPGFLDLSMTWFRLVDRALTRPNFYNPRIALHWIQTHTLPDWCRVNQSVDRSADVANHLQSQADTCH
ncbi:hypothetical protein PIB30_031823 [Stylosanthes scabra]|uniref:Cytochrome P450 n=1 Tax=Stylosanthes scabra TaxID=79078 RepID=A0ABU6RCJ1_9FABA|nr:hypothetical protein [Stylosanthes scabra]